jgi:putative salt-induced outer membrane protein YdiY
MFGKIIFCISVFAAAVFAGEELHVCPCCGKPLPEGYVLVRTTNAPPAALTNAQAVAATPEPAAKEEPVLEEAEPPHRDWKGSVYAGFNYLSGNTEETSYRYGADYEKKNGSDYSYKLNLDGRYRETDGQEKDSKADLRAEGRRVLGMEKRWFALGTVSVLHDDVKDLAYRLKIGPNVGYYLHDTKDLVADLSTGLLYVRENSDGTVEDYLAWRLAQWFDWHFTENTRWWFGTELFSDIGEPSDYHLVFRTAIETKINAHYSMIIVLENTYDNRPEPGTDIKKNDLEIGAGLRYTF